MSCRSLSGGASRSVPNAMPGYSLNFKFWPDFQTYAWIFGQITVIIQEFFRSNFARNFPNSSHSQPHVMAGTTHIKRFPYICSTFRTFPCHLSMKFTFCNFIGRWKGNGLKMEQIYGIFALKLTGESPLFFQKCAKIGRKFATICLAQIIMCKTIASPTLRYVTSQVLLLIYITVLRSRTKVNIVLL